VTSASVPAPPPSFVVVTQGARQTRFQMSLYSSATGTIVRPLASFSDSTLTNNGLAYAADGSAVYFTLIPQHHTRRFSLRIMRLDVATGRQAFIADGAQPALSHGGTQLAYGASPNGLAVRDLAANLLHATIGWLSDESAIAIIPAPTLWDLIGRPPRRP
jgi:hypothetical protein